MTAEPTRDLSSGIMAIVLTLLCGAGCYIAARQGGWWWLLFAVVAFIGVASTYGIFESFQKVPRNAKGYRL